MRTLRGRTLSMSVILCCLLAFSLAPPSATARAANGVLGARSGHGSDTVAPRVTTIHVGPHPLAVAVDPNTHHIFVAVEGLLDPLAEHARPVNVYGRPTGPGSVSMLSSNGTVLETTTVGVFPEAIAIDARLGRAFVLNIGPADGTRAPAGTISILDTRTGLLLRTVPIGGVSPALAVDDRTGRVFVLIQGTVALGPPERLVGNAVHVLDAATGKLIRTVSLPAVPETVAVDAPANRAILSDHRDIVVLDAASGQPVATIPLEDGCAVAARAYRAVVEGPYGPSRQYPGERVTILDTRSGAIVTTLDLGTAQDANNGCLPQSVAIDERTDRVYVINHSAVSAIDLRTGKLLRTTPQNLSAPPIALAVDQQRHRAFICADPGLLGLSPYSSPQGSVQILDTRTNAIQTMVRVGDQPGALAIDEATGRVFVANRGGDTMSMIDPT